VEMIRLTDVCNHSWTPLARGTYSNFMSSYEGPVIGSQHVYIIPLIFLNFLRSYRELNVHNKLKRHCMLRGLYCPPVIPAELGWFSEVKVGRWASPELSRTETSPEG